MHWWDKIELEEKVADLTELNIRLQRAVLKLERQRDKLQKKMAEMEFDPCAPLEGDCATGPD